MKHLAKFYSSPLQAERELLQSLSQSESTSHKQHMSSEVVQDLPQSVGYPFGSYHVHSQTHPHSTSSGSADHSSSSRPPPGSADHSSSSWPPPGSADHSSSSRPPPGSVDHSSSSGPPPGSADHSSSSGPPPGSADHSSSSGPPPGGSNRVGRERRVRIATQPVQSPQLEPSLQIGTVDTLRCQLSNLTTDEQLQLCGELFSQICSSHPAHTIVPGDFMALSLKAMNNLKESGRRNVLYELALGLGSLRPDGTPLFPIDRMPMGLLEYMVNFFASSNISEVSLVW